MHVDEAVEVFRILYYRTLCKNPKLFSVNYLLV